MRVILFPCFNCEVNKKFSVLSKDKKGLARVELLEAIKEVFLSSAFSESIHKYSCQVLQASVFILYFEVSVVFSVYRRLYYLPV